MPDLEQECAHLTLADRHIAEGEKRVADQTCLIERLTGQGRDTVAARDLLRMLEETLVCWREHRQLIREAIARRYRALGQTGHEALSCRPLVPRIVG